MNRKIEITYWWKRDDGKRIKPGHVEALEERAQEQIFAAVGNGTVCGELFDSVRMGPRDGEEGVGYSGGFEIENR